VNSEGRGPRTLPAELCEHETVLRGIPFAFVSVEILDQISQPLRCNMIVKEPAAALLCNRAALLTLRGEATGRPREVPALQNVGRG
jgi:hypothetical protein